MRAMTDKETAAHIRRWLDEKDHSVWSWPTDACGYEQHMRFADHRNASWHGGTDDEWKAFVAAYADSLDLA